MFTNLQVYLLYFGVCVFAYAVRIGVIISVCVTYVLGNTVGLITGGETFTIVELVDMGIQMLIDEGEAVDQNQLDMIEWLCMRNDLSVRDILNS